MPDDAEQRMIRLRDELIDIRYDYKWCAFDVIKCSSQTPIEWSIKEHEFLRARISVPGTGYFHLRYAEPTVRSWFDPLPDRTTCIWWCGLKNDRGGVERLQDWADRCSQFIDLNMRYARRFQISKPCGGRGNLIQALCTFARNTLDLSAFIEEKVILDLGETKASRGIPNSLRKLKPSPSFSLMIPDSSGPLFLLRVLDHALGRPSIGPRLTVDVNNLAATLDGTTYRIDWPYILVVQALVDAHGNPIDRKRMQELYEGLQGYKRLDREVIKKLKERECPPIGALIESSQAGYWIPAEYLA